MSEEKSSQDTQSMITRLEASVEWKIKELFSLPKDIGYELKSPIFLLSDAKWRLRFYPNGFRVAEAGFISLYLHRKGFSTKKHHVSYTIGIRKSDGSTYMSKDTEHEFQNDTGNGWHKFLETTKLLTSKDVVAPDESLAIYCTAKVSTAGIVDENVVETASQTQSSESFEILQQNLKDLFLSGRQGDVTFKVQDQEFQAHRCILSTRSPVFLAMFDHDTEEKKTGIVKITDCDPESFKTFLSFMYDGKMDMVPSGNAVVLYKTADKYDLKDLKNECVRVMTEELSVESFCDVFLLASIHDESKLLQTASNFFVENVKKILTTTEWQSLVSEHSLLANELFIQVVNSNDSADFETSSVSN